MVFAISYVVRDVIILVPFRKCCLFRPSPVINHGIEITLRFWLGGGGKRFWFVYSGGGESCLLYFIQRSRQSWRFQRIFYGKSTSGRAFENERSSIRLPVQATKWQGRILPSTCSVLGLYDR